MASYGGNNNEYRGRQGGSDNIVYGRGGPVLRGRRGGNERGRGDRGRGYQPRDDYQKRERVNSGQQIQSNTDFSKGKPKKSAADAAFDEMFGPAPDDAIIASTKKPDTRRKFTKQALLDAFVKTNELDFSVFEKSGLLESAVMFNESQDGEGKEPENFSVDPTDQSMYNTYSFKKKAQTF